MTTLSLRGIKYYVTVQNTRTIPLHHQKWNVVSSGANRLALPYIVVTWCRDNYICYLNEVSYMTVSLGVETIASL